MAKLNLKSEELKSLAKEPVKLIEAVTRETGVSEEDLIIKSGPRIIYGKPVNSKEKRQEFLNEPAYLKQIIEKIHESPQTDFTPQKRPDLEITYRGATEPLFRLESNGKLSVNNLQIEQEIKVDFDYADAFSDAFAPERDEGEVAAVEAEIVAVVEAIQNSERKSPSVRVEGGRIGRLLRELVENSEPLVQSQSLESPIPNNLTPLQELPTVQLATSEAERSLSILESASESLLSEKVGLGLKKIAQSLKGQQQLMKGVVGQLSAKAQKMVADGMAREKAVKETLKSLDLKAVVRDTAKSVLMETGEAIKQVSQAIESVGYDLQSLAHDLDNQHLMNSAVKRFQEGFEQTGEQRYDVGDYTIEREGHTSLYDLSQGGKKLLSFAYAGGEGQIVRWHRPFESKQVANEINDRRLAVEGSEQVKAQYRERLGKTIEKIAHLKDGTQLGRLRVDKPALIDPKTRQPVRYETLKPSQIRALEQAVAGAYEQQRLDRVLPPLLTHLEMVGKLEAKTKDGWLKYDDRQRILDYTTSSGESVRAQKTKNGKWLGAVNLSSQKEAEITEGLANIQKSYGRDPYHDDLNHSAATRREEALEV